MATLQFSLQPPATYSLAWSLAWSDAAAAAPAAPAATTVSTMWLGYTAALVESSTSTRVVGAAIVKGA